MYSLVDRQFTPIELSTTGVGYRRCPHLLDTWAPFQHSLLLNMVNSTGLQACLVIRSQPLYSGITTNGLLLFAVASLPPQSLHITFIHRRHQFTY